MKGRITINEEFCKSCKFCIEFCPKGVIDLSDKMNSKGYNYVYAEDFKNCTGCAICALVCPEAAIEVYREK